MCRSDLGRVELANLFQLNAQAVPQGAFRTQLFQQRLSLVESIWRNVFALKKIPKATLNFRFGKQGMLLEEC
jgi:hypothetical protein